MTKSPDRRVPLTAVNFAEIDRIRGELTMTEYLNTLLTQILQPVKLPIIHPTSLKKS
ncbi:hypothetical protein U2F10_36040 [Leptothoe sp. EHU-05/26/07-4]